MSNNKILFILGAGPNVATALQNTLRRKDIKSPSPDKIPEWFAQVKKKYGGAPNVVIHNAYHVFPAHPQNPLSLSLGQLNYDLAVNVTSAYLAAQEAVKGFETLPAELPNLGLGKTALGHVIGNTTLAFQGKGYTFYYGDFASGAISGIAHAERYWELSQDRKQRPWMDTFVAGQEYKDLPKV